MNASNNIEIANTIVQQMGGTGRLRAMLGAKLFIAIDNGLQFKFPNRLRSRGNCVRIELEPNDTYKVSFWSIGSRAKLVREVEGVYCDGLKSLFEEQTGLRLSLGF